MRRFVTTVLACLLTFSQAHADVTVEVRGEPPLVAQIAAWRPADQVLVVFSDGTDRLIPAHKVLRILDQNGVERRTVVVYGRKLVGEYPDAYHGSRKAMTSNFRPFLIAGSVAAGIGVLLIIIIATGGGPSVQE